MKRTFRWTEQGVIEDTSVRCNNEENHKYMAVSCSCGFRPERAEALHTGRYA